MLSLWTLYLLLIVFPLFQCIQGTNFDQDTQLLHFCTNVGRQLLVEDVAYAVHTDVLIR